uniref:Uncharacterized protein n=1 Tax=Ditylenchus dipsaci TaxID=166011 RepID=A0A915EWG5_9BILA
MCFLKVLCETVQDWKYQQRYVLLSFTLATLRQWPSTEPLPVSKFGSTTPPKINVVDENGDSIGRQHKSNSVEDLAALDSPGSGTSSQMRMSLSNEAKKLTTRASELIVHVPAKHFRRIVETRGMSSVTRETQHFE